MALTVNGERIEDSVIQQEVERLRPDYERIFKDQNIGPKDPKEQEAQLLDWSRENVIERVLLNQYVKKDDCEIPVVVAPSGEADVEAAFDQMKKRHEGRGEPAAELSSGDEKKIKQDIELQMKVERLLESICKDLPELPEDSIGEFYQERKEQFKTPEQVRAAHIVKYVNWQTGEKAAYDAICQVQEELKKGVAFEMLVDKYTDCSDRGGGLGYIARGQMVEEFEDVAFNLGAGEVSNVFRSRFGFHIVKVYDRKPRTVLSLDQVRDRIVDELKEQMRSKAIDEFIDHLKSEAKIEEM